MNLILTGMPGSGKSAVAVKLSEALGMAVADTDKIIEEGYGKISEIFEKYGEERFRKIESEVIYNLSALKDAVISTGGGCILNGGNVKILKSLGVVVYLKTGLEELLKRLQGDVSRPLLSGDKKAELSKIYSERAALYEKSADLTVETDGKTVDGIVKIIMERIK